MNQGSTTSSSRPAAPVPVAIPQVTVYLSELSQALDSLEKTIMVHSERITPALSAPQPSAATDQSVPPRPSCPLADHLMTAVTHVRALENMVGYLTARIEV